MIATASIPRDTVAWLATEKRFAERFGDESKWPVDEVQMAVCERAEIPVIPLSVENVDMDAFERLHEVCIAQRFLPTFAQNIVLCIVTPAAYNVAVLREIKRHTHKELRVLACLESAFDLTLAEADAQLAAIKAQRVIDNPVQKTRPAERWNTGGGPLSSVVKEIVTNAVLTGASDIQIEPAETQVDVRFFYGAKWEVMPPIELRYRDGIVKAFKDAAGLSSLSHEPFQSAKASFQVGGRHFDLRIEVAPFVFGDGISARVLERGRFKGKASLPFLPRDLEIVEHVIHQKQGMILVVGPTGSGKTTLMSSLLTQLDSTEKNIRTVEDPPEYTLDRIQQIEVGEKVGRTFAQGLKSLLRQKPDVVMVGEIRSSDVAQTAVDAALTGHVVFASLHTNDSAGVSPRLIEMGVKPYVLQSTLLAVIAVRLVPVLCPNCKQADKPSAKACTHFRMHGLPVPEHVFKRAGCHKCNDRGTVGRRSIYEILYPDDALRELFQADVPESKIRDAWVASGGIPMVRFGLNLVAAGDVEWEEVRAYETKKIEEPAGK